MQLVVVGEREDTTVQLGRSLASAAAGLFRFDPSSVRIVLMAGVAAGLGAVFALEVLAVGRVDYVALVPCLLAPPWSATVPATPGASTMPLLRRPSVRAGPARPIVGGLAVIALAYLLGTRAHLGFGVWSAIPGDPPSPASFSWASIDGGERPHLTTCVELIGQREQLERFCRAHGDVLASKVIVYKHLEYWSIEPAGLRHDDLHASELAHRR